MISAVILAGGIGERFGSRIPKPFMKLNGKPVIQYSIDVIEPLVDEVIVVSAEPYRHYKHAQPGKTRQESTLNGLRACSKPEHVILHDAVRPFITSQMVKNVIDKLKYGYVCVSTAAPIIDGFIGDVTHVSDETFGTPSSKDQKYLAQTPEGFYYDTLRRAHEQANERGLEFQDSICLLNRLYRTRPVIVPGVQLNTKLTFAQDLDNAEGLMRFRSTCLETTPNLKGKHFLVLGGSGGIGSACIRMLEEHGATLFQPSSSWLNLVTDSFYHLDYYDGIVHAAGEYRNPGEIFAVNTLSCHRLLTQAAEHGFHGNVVFLSSSSATYGRPGHALYSASKAALNSLIESMHEELSQKGIFVNAIAPSKVDTPLIKVMHGDINEPLLNPDYVAERVLRYLDTQVHGQIVYLRNGMENK